MDNLIAFMIYSYLGGTIEQTSYYFSNTEKKLTDPFINGFPLFGIGAYIVIIINKYLNLDNIVLNFLVFAIILTLLELVVGIIVDAGKNSHDNGQVVMWDYSDEFGNFKGIISIWHFIVWGILAVILIKIHPKLMYYINNGINNNCNK